MSLGIARRCTEVMVRYAKERRAFGEPLNRFGQVQRHVAESYAEYAAGRAFVYATARAMDLRRSGGRVDSDAVKLYCGPMATAVAGRAMQVLGGNGYVGAYNVERLWRDAKLLEIGGGTNESHQKNIVSERASERASARARARARFSQTLRRAQWAAPANPWRTIAAPFSLPVATVEGPCARRRQAPVRRRTAVRASACLTIAAVCRGGA